MQAVSKSEERVHAAGLKVSAPALLIVALALSIATSASAQLSAMPPPSATSIGGHRLPLPPPSVSSIKPYGYGGVGHSGGRYGNRGYGRRANGYGYGGYALPYYIPYDTYGDDYDYVGGGGYGPDLYSGPPIDPRDQTLHIIVEQPPAGSYRVAPDDPRVPSAQSQPPAQEQAGSIHDAKPGEPTVLVYRDGHQQQVTNYAIMGQTLYIFDSHTKKVQLSELDLPATVKANEEEGIEFEIPATPTHASKPTAPTQSAPDSGAANLNNLTTSLR